MDVHSNLKQELDHLITLMMTLGVQPSELADNIFLESYSQLNFYKKNSYIIADISFEENNSLTTLRYFYNQNKELFKIEELSFNGTILQWDRDIDKLELLNKILNLLKNNYSTSEINYFISTLPVDLQSLLNKQLSDFTCA